MAKPEVFGKLEWVSSTEKDGKNMKEKISKEIRRVFSIAVLGMFLFSAPVMLSSFASTSNGSACSVTVTAENVGNTAVQDAINNAETHVTGPVVCVDPGTFPEQLKITSSGITLRGLGTATNPTKIQPTSAVPNSVSPDSGHDQINIIVAESLVLNSITGITVSNLVVDGSLLTSYFTTAGFSCGEPITGNPFGYEGILFQNAGGVISGNTVENILLPSNLAGCQPGDAILVQSSPSWYASVMITNNKALNYNKNGITCNDPGTSCWISHNTVSFYTPYEANIAPNGIQIAFLAWGKVTDNKISNNICNVPTICGSNLLTQTQSGGILTDESKAGTILSGNTLSNNQIGILLFNDTASQSSNKISSSTVAGILQYDGSGTYSASGNTLSNNPIGIAVVSDASPSPAGYTGTFTSKVSSTTFNSDPIHIQVITQSTGVAILKFAGHTFTFSGDSTTNIV
jgi:parallel beta-helix repeat protein